MNPSLIQPNESVSSLLIRYVRPVFEWRTYLNLLYLILAFPLGLAYFLTLIIGFAVGVPLLIIWVGILILLLVFAIWWLFLIAERQLGIWLLGEDIPPMMGPAGPDETVFQRAVGLLRNPVTWKGLLFLLLKLPLGIVSFTLAVFILAFSATSITAPLTYWFAEINVGFWRVDTLPEAVILALFGVLLAPLWVQISNLVALGFGRFAHWALGLQDIQTADLAAPKLQTEEKSEMHQ